MLSLFKNEEEKREFYHEVAERNVSGGKKLICLVLIFEIFMMIYALLCGRFHTLIHCVYICLYMFLLVISVIALILILLQQKKHKFSDKFILYACTIYAVVLMIWGILISTLDSGKSYQLTVYMTVSMGVSFAITLNPFVMQILQILSYLSFISISIFSNLIEFNFNKTLNLTIFIIILVLTSIATYKCKIADFRQKCEINKKNDQLGELNLRLNTSNE